MNTSKKFTAAFIRAAKALFYFLLLFIFSGLSLSAGQDRVQPGIDILKAENFSRLKGKRIALLTNFAGRTADLESTALLFSQTKACSLASILVPEHGYFGSVPAGQKVENDRLYSVPVYSLYGQNRRPGREMLKEIDMVVVDIQDIGVRSYTFLSTLYNTMDACAEYGIPLLLLDRPNPLGGLVVDGNVAEKGFLSFVGIIPVPYLHGMTIGELAAMINGEGYLPKSRKCSLNIVAMKGWKRSMNWEQTGLIWTPTSPHIPSVNAVRGAAMNGVFGELSLLNIGVGTTLPFQFFGMPSMKSEALFEEVKKKLEKNILPVEGKFRPMYGKFANDECKGILFQFAESPYIRAYSAGMELLLSLRRLHPELFEEKKIPAPNREMFCKVTGTDRIFKALFNGGSDEEVRKFTSSGLSAFLPLRKKYLIYN